MSREAPRLQGANGFREYVTGQSGNAAADLASGSQFIALVVAEDTVFSGITGTGITAGSGFTTRVHGQGFVVFGSIQTFGITSGAVYAYYD